MTADEKKTSPQIQTGDGKPIAAPLTAYRETRKAGKASADGSVKTTTKVTERKTAEADGSETVEEDNEIDVSVDGQVLGQVFGSENDALTAGKAFRDTFERRGTLGDLTDSSKVPTREMRRKKP